MRPTRRSCALYGQLPAIWQAVGDLSVQAQERLITLALNTSYSTREAIARTLAAIRDQLGYAASSELEKLLIEQVLICHLCMQILELTLSTVPHAKDGCTLTKAEHQDRLLTSTQGALSAGD